MGKRASSLHWSCLFPEKKEYRDEMDSERKKCLFCPSRKRGKTKFSDYNDGYDDYRNKEGPWIKGNLIPCKFGKKFAWPSYNLRSCLIMLLK